MKRTLLIATLVGWTASARAAPVMATVTVTVRWAPMDAPAAAAELADLLPAGARVVRARSGELLRVRVSGREPPSFGRLWQRGASLAYLDESDLAVRERGEWRWRVPLGSHSRVVVSARGELSVDRAVEEDIGYGWEVYEDAIVAWDRGAAPAPPAPAAEAAFDQARAADALLAAAGVDAGARRHLRTAIALADLAVARPLVGPYFRANGTPLARRLVAAGETASFVARGPLVLLVTATDPRATAVEPRPRADGVEPAADGPLVRIDLDGVSIAGGPRSEGRWSVRLPAGEHEVTVAADRAPALIAAAAFRKRNQTGDAITGAKDIEGHAAAALAGVDTAAPRAARLLVLAESLRLRGHLRMAALTFATLGTSPSPAAQAYASWRLGELTGDARHFDRAAEALARAGAANAGAAPGAGDVVAIAVARARARVAIAAGDPGAAADAVAAHPSLWSDPSLAAPLAGVAGDTGGAVARLVAAATGGRPGGAAAIRRAWFDRTEWTGAAGNGGHDTVAVLAPDATTGRCSQVADAGDAVYLLGPRPLAVDIPAEPLGSGRFRVARIHVRTDRIALDTALVVDGAGVPLPTLFADERHRVALAPGRRLLAASGGGQVFFEPPPGVVPDSTPDQLCAARWRRRAYARLPADLDVSLPAGGVVGLEFRQVGPVRDRVAHATIRIGGHSRRISLRLAASAGASTPFGTLVSAPIAIDLQAPRSRLHIINMGGAGDTLLVRPLVRTTRSAGGTAAAAWFKRMIARAAAARMPDPPDGADLRVLGRGIVAAATPIEKADLLLRRATLLARRGRTRYAVEDLQAAAALDPLRAGLLRGLIDAQSSYAPPPVHGNAYALDPTAAILAEAAKDPATRLLADKVRHGDAAAVRDHLRQGRAHLASLPTSTLALAARLDDDDTDPAGAAAAYAILAARHPEHAALRVAEAARGLDALQPAAFGTAHDDAPATRAFTAAVLAGDAPGAGDALLRASDATRWRRVIHAERSAGSERGPPLPPPPDASFEVRAALAAPDLPVAEDAALLWLEPGVAARAVFDARAGARPAAEIRCVDLRPAATDRRAPEPGCRVSLRIDGNTVATTRGGAITLSPLARGRHSFEVALAEGGADALAAVRMTLAGKPLRARIDAPRWLADPDEPVTIAVVGPTVLRLELASTGAAPAQVTIRERDRAGSLATASAPSGRRAAVLVPLPEERPYQIDVVPAAGRIAVTAAAREDHGVPAPRIVPAAAEPPGPALAGAGPPPAVPAALLRFVDHDAPGTITLTTGLRDGALGERDTTTERGGRYAEADLAYRRRRGNAWFLVHALGRARVDGPPTAGGGGRIYWSGGMLRLDGSALALTQGTDTGTAATLWLAGAAQGRFVVGRDWFFVPTLAGIRRVGTYTDPGGEALDPDVWSSFDAAHPAALIGQARVDFEPFLDLAVHGRARATTNADLATIDRTAAYVGIDGVLARLRWAAEGGAEHRFADRDRPEARTRVILRAALAYSVWHRGDGRLSATMWGTARPGDRSDIFFGISYDWTFGRGLVDFAPDDSRFAGQLGPYPGSSP